jgi:hypothetical protein
VYTVALDTMETVEFIEIVAFKRTFLPKNIWDLIPDKTKYEHWGIFVHLTDGTKLLYHADKANIQRNTKSMFKEWPKDINDPKYDKADFILLVGYTAQDSNALSKDKLIEYCDNIDKDRVFNILTNNCQEWVKSVLKELIENKHLPFSACDMLKGNDKMIPLKGW